MNMAGYGDPPGAESARRGRSQVLNKPGTELDEVSEGDFAKCWRRKPF